MLGGLLASAALFFSTPAPLDMPRAEAFLVREDGVQRLEDRYDTFDLWTSRTVTGRWMDGDWRTFVLASLSMLPPPVEAHGTVTRATYESEVASADVRNEAHLARMVAALAPVEVAAEPSVPSQLPRGCRAVRYFEGTNASAIVCAFLPSEASAWQYACWTLAEDDDPAQSRKVFEDEFLARRLYEALPTNALPARASGKRKPGRPAPVDERELLRRDAAHSVAAYRDWRVTSSPSFVLLDNLGGLGGGVVGSITNALPALRERFAAAVPSPLDGSNTLAVARLYRDREDYLAAAGEEMQWSAAYWCQARRELVAYLPDGGAAELERTFRHEAFHQYLSYAASMVPASPWFNEGFAQYFEDETADGLGLNVAEGSWDEMAEMLPALFDMDYAGFYGGSDAERRAKYRLAWSVVKFLQDGAPQVRFQPFRDLARDYVSALLMHRDMRRATWTVFGTTDKLKLFTNEWKKYWQNR